MWDSLTKTRFKGLALARFGKAWIYVDTETDHQIGVWYKSKIEALSDLTQFASERGFEID